MFAGSSPQKCVEFLLPEFVAGLWAQSAVPMHSQAAFRPPRYRSPWYVISSSSYCHIRPPPPQTRGFTLRAEFGLPSPLRPSPPLRRRDGEKRDFLTRVDEIDEAYRLLIVSPALASKPDWCPTDCFKTKEIPE